MATSIDAPLSVASHLKQRISDGVSIIHMPLLNAGRKTNLESNAVKNHDPPGSSDGSAFRSFTRVAKRGLGYGLTRRGNTLCQDSNVFDRRTARAARKGRRDASTVSMVYPCGKGSMWAFEAAFQALRFSTMKERRARQVYDFTVLLVQLDKSWPATLTRVRRRRSPTGSPSTICQSNSNGRCNIAGDQKLGPSKVKLRHSGAG